MASGIFIRTIRGLEPSDSHARESLRGVSIGSLIVCGLSRPRNLKMLNLYWKIVSTVAEAIGADSESVSDILKLRTGHVRIIQTKKGLERLPRSISFAELDQAGFNTFYDRCMVVLCEEFLPHMKPNEFRRQIEEMVGGSSISENPRSHKPAKKAKPS